MLTALRIEDFVLIDRLSLEFENGLSALTGETGAGKSILLDALGLALGGRMEAGMIRAGAKQTSITAVFNVPEKHPVHHVLKDAGLPGEDSLVLRRVITEDGRSKAFINDQPVSIGLIKQAGGALAEIHGQFETQGLLDPQTHRAALDQFAGLSDALRMQWHAWRQARQDLDALKEQALQARRDETYLRQSLEDLDALSPEAGEEQILSAKKERLAHREKIVAALAGAYDALTSENDPLAQAQRSLDKVRHLLNEGGQQALAALDRAQAETQESILLLQAASHALEEADESLEDIDERLNSLRVQARKHHCSADDLPALREDLRERLALIEHAGAHIDRQAREVEKARSAFVAAAEKISRQRHEAAKKLDALVAKELAPLKMEKARFMTAIEPLAEPDWNEHGIDHIRFLIASNPGAAPGPIAKIASGGELARFMLALKVVMAAKNSSQTLIFDEVDSGIGGATADAVGERLSKLAKTRQVLVVTHSPQVAAQADHHFTVRKSGGKKVKTDVVSLHDKTARREEIARMLSGAEITAEARAAADRLLRTGT